jgi:predicted ATPase
LTDSASDHPLRRIKLRNFKSVLEADIEMAPLTVLVGANSSGKSSILQTILALHQVAVSETPLSTFALNGPKSSLGYFQQVRNQSAGEPDVEIGIDMWLRVADVAPVPMLLNDWTLYNRLRSHPTDIRFKVAFSELAERGDEAASPSIVGVDLEATGVELQATLALRRELPQKGMTRGSAIVSSSWYPPDLHWRFDESFRGRLKGSSSAKVTAAAFTGGVPASLVSTARGAAVADLFAELLLSILDRFPSPPRDVKVTVNDIRRVADCAVAVMVPWAGQDSRARNSQTNLVNDVLEVLKNHGVLEKSVVSATKRRDDLVAAIRERWPTRGATQYLLEGQDSSVIAYAATQILGFLSSHAFYLAGLRVAPQPLYPFTPLPSDSDIGTRGENLASVLITIGDREVECPAEDGTVTTKTLQESLRQWIRSLGLLDDIEPLHRGAQGFALQVRQASSEQPLDVSAVGVGVSQVLPVLVRCLLAEPGDLVLLEQPELHLHPAAQLQLADFLLACVRSGRQIVVETHSEHLVNRLRRRVAEAEDDTELGELVRIVFAERNDAGVTEYRPVELNSLGGFASWPRGFFPEGAEEVRQLLEAGLRKRARTVESG